MQVYPGLCKGKPPACPGATNLCVAVPEDGSDPFQTNWTKDGKAGSLTGYTNPIANNTGRDPSTAWQTPAGEWRFTSYGSQLFGSMDFKQWYRLGQQKQFPAGECPSFFKLPRATPGAGPAPAGAAHPTHVYKSSHGGKDWMSVGSYVAGPPKTLGNFSAMGAERLIDRGSFYASKDFYDPVGQRRINWGWAQIAYGPWNDGNAWESSSHTLAREVTWHPELSQLVFAPLAEQEQLRSAVLGQLKPQPLNASQPLSLGLPSGTGRQAELAVSFQRPSVAVTLSVRVMAGTASPGVDFTVEYVPGKNVATVSSVGAGRTVADTLALSPSDKTIDLRVFVDNVMAEAYFMGGRVAMTVAAPSHSLCPDGRCGMYVTASQAGATLASATAWGVKSIWVSPEEVLRTPRRDGGNVELMAERTHEQQRSG